MTTTNTNDTEACVRQAEEIIKAGGELVRFTTQGSREAENMKNINAGIRADGYQTPLVADVHFNPNVADVAALYCEKVRVNPGNYVDPARKFIKQEYTDEEYAHELQKIEDRFVPFLNICKEHHTAIRIGVNHGSLSDRIRNRYGDTPEGIVESCLEFLRICKKENFHDVVISIKSSNTVVMVRSMRLLVEEMEKEGMNYPLHLGVTEAGEGEDGRIKSAVGIGALLADGIGDTVRVSLSEEPAAEIPVARHLVDYIGKKKGHLMIPATACPSFDWLRPTRRETVAVGNIGGSNVPVVISNRINGESTACENKDATPDYIYIGGKMPKQFVAGQSYIVDYNVYETLNSKPETTGAKLYPIFPAMAMPLIASIKADVKFLTLQFGTPADEYIACLKAHPEVVVICVSNHQNRLGDQRALVHEMMNAGLKNPVVFAEMYQHSKEEKSDFQLEAAADMGARFLEKPQGGKGKLMGGVPGVRPARVLILGGGVVGTNAAQMAAGMGAEVMITDVNLTRLRYLSEVLPKNVKTLYSSLHNIKMELPTVDLVIGSVLIPGDKAPHLITREMLKMMKPGTVLVDVAIDQGGCFETSHPTTYNQPRHNSNSEQNR
jgi:(E)-4-hydroxy-3-methylbut-2-enyl-diphosphate synthase